MIEGGEPNDMLGDIKVLEVKKPVVLICSKFDFCGERNIPLRSGSSTRDGTGLSLFRSCYLFRTEYTLWMTWFY